MFRKVCCSVAMIPAVFSAFGLAPAFAGAQPAKPAARPATARAATAPKAPLMASVDPALFSVGSAYFLVTGRVTIRQATLQLQALVERTGAATHLLWMREA